MVPTKRSLSILCPQLPTPPVHFLSLGTQQILHLIDPRWYSTCPAVSGLVHPLVLLTADELWMKPQDKVWGDRQPIHFTNRSPWHPQLFPQCKSNLQGCCRNNPVAKKPLAELQGSQQAIHCSCCSVAILFENREIVNPEDNQIHVHYSEGVA